MCNYASKCLWCGGSLADRPRKTRFCTPHCRDHWQGLRRLRGEQVYDMLMLWASSYKERKVITDIGRLVRGWRDEDAKVGRKTWRKGGE